MAVDKSLPHLGKPAGGNIRKIQQTSSEEMDGKGTTPQGTENIPRKPPLHRKLTGLLSMQVNINEDKENSGDRSKICKILEAQSEKPEKAEKGVGNSRAVSYTHLTLPTILRV